MFKTHNRLSLEERAMTQVMLDHRCSLRAIARKLRRSASTISRELARSGGAVTDPLAVPSPALVQPAATAARGPPARPATGPQSPCDAQDAPGQWSVGSDNRRPARGPLARAGQRHTATHAR